MRVFRLCQSKWATSAFSGEGALRYAGRWHEAGTPVVYAASSLALAALELLVHFEIRHAPPDFVAIAADVPDELIQKPDPLPARWDALPASAASRAAGTLWARDLGSVALRVPSVVVRGEHNVLLNPRHPDFHLVSIGPPEPFVFDPRPHR